MLVSFCGPSTVVCPLSSYYGVIHALYRVIDTRLRCFGDGEVTLCAFVTFLIWDLDSGVAGACGADKTLLLR